MSFGISWVSVSGNRGRPSWDVNTRSETCHSGPASSRSAAWASRCFSRTRRVPPVDSDHSAPATLGGPIDPFAVDHTGRALESDDVLLEVKVGPTQVQHLSPSGSGERRDPVEGVKSMARD